MATQIATLFVKRLEVPVVMRDLEQARVDEALKTIREDVARAQAVPRDARRRRHRLGAVRRLRPRARGGLRGARRQARGLRRACARSRPSAILATNTSSLSVEEMGADVGMHFFNPVAVMPLVEIVRTPHDDDEVLATAWDVVKKLKKRGVIVGDAPGFVVNRVLTRVIARADRRARARQHRRTRPTRRCSALGMPMAPSVLMQMVGPRVANHVLETMHDAYPDRFPLSPDARRRSRTARSPSRSPSSRAHRRGDPRGGARGGGGRDPPHARRGRRRRPRPTSTPA